MSLITSSQTIYFARKPHPKETVCGDDGAAWDDADNTWIVISDGLGHGKGAAEATDAALVWLTSNYTNDLEATIRGCDRAIRHTRGVSLNIARISRSSQTATYASVGANLGWKLRRSENQRLVGDSDVVGAGISNIRLSTVNLDGAGFLILASDGLSTSSDVAEIYNSSFETGSNLAESCLNRWDTGRDDSSILMYRFTS